MACIFAIYSRRISTILSLLHLHFLLFWGYVSGSIASLPPNSGLCPVRSFSNSLPSLPTLSTLSASLPTLSSPLFSSTILTSSSTSCSSSTSSSCSTSSSSSSSTSTATRKCQKTLKKKSLQQKLKEDPFLNRLSFQSDDEEDGNSEWVKFKRSEVMNEFMNPQNFFNSELVVIGLSHHTAPVEVREKLSIPESEWNNAAHELCRHDSISEAVVLSTCNRFELYLTGRNQYEAMTDAVNYLLERTNGTVDEDILRKSVFMLSGEDAIWHLMRVTAGLDSIVVGEGQILSQVTHAFKKSTQEDGKAGPILSAMMKSSISAGKRVRTETNICKGAISVSSAAVEFMSMKLQQEHEPRPFESLNQVIIGAGKMARLLLIHLESHGVKHVTLVNRSPESVKKLQAELPNLHLTYVPLTEMTSALSTSDIIYTCTSSATPIINSTHLTDILQTRQSATAAAATSSPAAETEESSSRGDNLPLVRFVDISVPRNIHSDCASLPSVECFNVDDLKEIVETNLFKRKREIVDAEMILKDEILKYEQLKESLATTPIAQRIQNKAEEFRTQEFSKLTKKLNRLTCEELHEVNNLSKRLVTNLLRGPLMHLKKSKATTDTLLQLHAAFQ